MDIGSDTSRTCGTAFVSSAIGAGAESPSVCGVDRCVEVIAVDLLKPSKINARTHSRKQVRQIANSLGRFGFCNPILIDDGNRIIAGHGRAEAAKLLGLKEVPVLRLSHLSATEKRAYALADNKLAELARWNRQILTIELQDLISLDFDIELTGFTMGEIDILPTDANEARRESASPEDKIPEITPGLVVSRIGDLWELGRHRLSCGDARDKGIDVAIRRWQTYTGKSATLAGTNKTFDEVEKERTGVERVPDIARDQAASANRVTA